jgi:hypothetical protein
LNREKKTIKILKNRSVQFGFDFISLKPKKSNRTKPNQTQIKNKKKTYPNRKKNKPNRKTEPNQEKPSQIKKIKPNRFEPVLS